MYFSDVSIGLKKPGFKTLGLSAVLLLSPVLLQAESSEAEPSEGSGTSEVTAGSVPDQQLDQQPDQQIDSDQQSRPAASHQAAAPVFPRWPQRQQPRKENIPPPPPGPYMSSALSDHSVKAPSFARDFNKPVYRHDPSFVPMDTFSPDIPWPKGLRGNKGKNAGRWKPKNGYRYAHPQMLPPRMNSQHRPKRAGSLQDPPQAMANGERRRYRGHNNVPNMSMPNMNMNGSRWMPSMGYAPDAPYYNAPTHRVQNPRFNRPDMNQSGSNQSGYNQSNSNQPGSNLSRPDHYGYPN